MYGVIDQMADKTIPQYDMLICYKGKVDCFATYREALEFALLLQSEGDAPLHYVVVPLPGIKGK